MPLRRPATLLLIAALGLVNAGCAGWGLPGGDDGPGAIGISPPGGGGGGGLVAPPPPVGGDDPAGGARPSIETPVPGQRDPAPVNVWKIEPSIDGRDVTVLLSWWSGVAPCSVLDSVEITRAGTMIGLTPREGSDPAAGDQVACPDIAMLHGTIVDLGELEPGTWTLAPSGDLAPLTITIE